MRDIQPSLKGVVELVLVFFLHYLTRILPKMLEANFLVFVGVRRSEMWYRKFSNGEKLWNFSLTSFSQSILDEKLPLIILIYLIFIISTY